MVLHGSKLSSADLARCNLCQRHQYKGSLPHARMRHHQPGRFNAGAAIEQQVQVERARRIAVRPFAPGLLLQLLQLIEQRGRIQTGFEGHDGIEIILARCGRFAA